MNRLIALALCSLLLSGCWLSGSPHSGYFIVTFLPGKTEPSGQGRQALANLAKRAGGASYVVIVATAPEGAPGAVELARQRADVVARTLLKAGVEGARINSDIRTVANKIMTESKDDLTVQLGYGEAKPD